MGLCFVLGLLAIAGCATGDEPMDAYDTGRIDPPDVSFSKDTDRQDVEGRADTGDGDQDVFESPDVLDGGADVGGDVDDSGADSGADVGEADVAVEPDVEPGVDAGPEPCNGLCGARQVCENNVCVEVCQRTGSQCGAVVWSGVEIQCGSCTAPSACFENRCADNNGYRAITAGFNHTCATRAQGGAVRCWGDNSVGQLGNNKGGGATSNQPVGVHVLSTGVLQLNTQTDHTCAVHTNGEVYCWGRNTRGQLGEGTMVDGVVPVKAHGISGSEAVATGASHSCALLSGSGEIQCWGEGGQGQLGTGNNTSTNSVKTYVMSSLQTRLSNNVAVVAGSLHSCALGADGSVWCWGYNDRGQAGGADNLLRWPREVAGLEPVQQLAAGAKHTCALTQAGAVKCWGEGVKGQLGNGARNNSTAPVTVQFQGSVRIERVVAGGNHTCAIDSQRRAWCWGDNSKGQIGGEMFNADTPDPFRVSVLTDILTMSAGFNHTCAVRTNGVAHCWGANDLGQLGDGTNIDRNKPVMVLN